MTFPPDFPAYDEIKARGHTAIDLERCRCKPRELNEKNSLTSCVMQPLASRWLRLLRAWLVSAKTPWRRLSSPPSGFHQPVEQTARRWEVDLILSPEALPQPARYGVRSIAD